MSIHISLFNISPVQVALALQAAKQLAGTSRAQAVILAGDFNSLPNDPAYALVKSKKLTEDMVDSIHRKTAFLTTKKVSVN